MSFYKFEDGDIINTFILAHPAHKVELNGDQVTGSIYLEHQFLSSSLSARQFQGFSAAKGGYIKKLGPFSSSVDILDAESGSTNKELYCSVEQMYDYYSIVDSDYTSDFTGSTTTRFRVITIPTIYYDREILTGSFSASDLDAAGDARDLFDNGRGGIYSGSLTGTIVGNIFYNEGLVVLKGKGLNDEGGSNDFGESSPTNFKWKVNFKGTHKIPTKIFRCRAPAGQLNASTNATFYHTPTASGSKNKNEKELVISGSSTYISTIGLYDENYSLVGLAKTSQPIKKTEKQDLLFKIKLDF